MAKKPVKCHPVFRIGGGFRCTDCGTSSQVRSSLEKRICNTPSSFQGYRWAR